MPRGPLNLFVRRIVATLIGVGLATGAFATDALAQARPQPPATGKEPPRSEAPAPKKPRPNRVDRSKNLDFLFGALKAAPDADTAKAVETRILALWQVSGSDTTDLLMTRVQQAVAAKEIELGIELLNAIIDLQPDYIEGWHRRATLHFLQKDYGASLADLREVLAREPRHFGALVGLGMILQDLEEEKMALVAFRRALELHPHLPRVEELVRTLEEKVNGRPI